MTQSTNQARRTEGGFTLVELAIVMIIIGLLIGGILKGQELITNARVSSTTAQVKAVESGISGFRDKYAAVPGDIPNANGGPGGRIPGCAAATNCTLVGANNGDGLISVGAAGVNTFDPGAVVNGASESIASFAQLSAAGFIGGVNGGANNIAAGVSNPTTPLAGSWVLATSTGVNGTGLTGPTGTPATVLQSGLYLALSPLLTAVIPGGTGPLTPVQAASIDRKVDDGNPNTGTVRSTGAGAGTGAGNCASAVGIAGAYNESLGSAECGLYAKVM